MIKTIRKTAIGFLDGSIFDRQKMSELLPFLLFVTFLGVCNIANTYYAENTVRKHYVMKNEVKELQSEYIAVTSSLMIMSKQSEIVTRVSGLKLEESLQPPVKVAYNPNSKN